ncbi:MAG: hypothetical protein ACE5M4_09855 [Anaerolineales bacterium]
MMRRSYNSFPRGLSSAAREAMRGPVHAIRVLASRDYRRREQNSREVYSRIQEQSRYMWRDVPKFPAPKRRVLLVASNFLTAIKTEMSFLIAMRAAGFDPSVLTWRHQAWVLRAFKLWGVEEFFFWEDFLPKASAMPRIPDITSFDDVLALQVRGTRVGKYSASWVMRQERLGRFDPSDSNAWKMLMDGISEGARYVYAADGILKAASPNTVILVERGYSPWGQLFDLCLHRGVDVLQWIAAHKNDALILKRYNQQNQHLHPSSLSTETWEWSKRMPWGENQVNALDDELRQTYLSGEWYGEVGTQFSKEMKSPADLRAQLKLDPRKKTAIIFPHLFWDGTFFFGHDLFEDYEDWFVNTIRAAANNPRLNWIIKVHPANVIKRHRDSYRGEYSEITAIRRSIGDLPRHIKLLGAESNISTYSVLSIMDYCLTVRGTVGIEAASMGIPVLTAGTGRFDHLGFTLDSESVEEFLERLNTIENIEPLPAGSRELAQRYAYALFLLRPFQLSSLSFRYSQDSTASLVVSFEVDTVRDLVEAPDMQAFAEWACLSKAEDWIAGE